MGARRWLVWLAGSLGLACAGPPEPDSPRPPGLESPRAQAFGGLTPRELDASRREALDAFTERALARLGVPGAAIAVIQGKQIVYERVLGVRALVRPDAPVSRDTLFMIGSVTKPMTTLMQATLVDEGKLAWETPVTSHLPHFALGDAELTQRLVLWHMSCGCTGMPAQDLENLFEFEGVTPEERLHEMLGMVPTAALGARFQYSNLMVAAGGYAAARAVHPHGSLGVAYDAAMRERVFAPLGMTKTTLDFAVAERSEHAEPHARALDGATQPFPLSYERNVVPIRPAGGVWSTLDDMVRFALTELASGVTPEGRRVVSEANFRERRKPRIASGTGESYGLGVVIASYRGLKSVGHDGGALGFGATWFLLPEQGVGIVILTNARTDVPGARLPFNSVVKERVLEALFDASEARAEKILDEYARSGTSHAQAALARVEAVNPHWFATLAGAYTNASLGTVWLRTGPLGATFDVGEWKSTLTRRTEADGTVKLVLIEPPFAGGELVVTGSPKQPVLEATYPPKTYRFERLSR